jgi:hypothetical protein
VAGHSTESLEISVKRYRPSELLDRYRAIRGETTTEAFFRDPAHKKTQEMWCAAHFSRGREKHFGQCFVHISDSDEQTDADFELEVSRDRHRFQITELMQPGRRRGDEYKGGESGKAHLEDWTPGTEHGPTWVREAIEKKANKRYAGARDLNLLVYLNFPAYEQRFDVILRECAEAAQHFASVWLLNGNAICCIREGDGFDRTNGWLPIQESLADADL